MGLKQTLILVCIGFRNDKYMILYRNIVANTLHNSINEFSGLCGVHVFVDPDIMRSYPMIFVPSGAQCFKDVW